MKNIPKNQSRSLLCAGAGLLTVLMVAGGTKPAAAQASDAADRCTPDVMRFCSEFVPDADRIVGCLKAKRRQLSQARIIEQCIQPLVPQRADVGQRVAKGQEAPRAPSWLIRRRRISLSS